jgi:tetratricopeptide (TPR) repeat protein
VALFSGLVAATVTYVDADLRLLSLAALVVGVAHFIHYVAAAGPRGRLLGAGVAVAAIGVFGLLPRLVLPGAGIHAEDHLHLGLLYDQEGRGSAALREYDRALRLDPDNPYPRLAMAALLARDNAPPESIKELEILVSRHPDSVTGLEWLTRMYQRDNRWTEAAAVYTRLAELEPWNPEHLNNLGTMYVQLGLYEQAARALNAALDVDSTYTTARENLTTLQEKGFAPVAPEAADSVRLVQEGILGFVRRGDLPGAEAALEEAYARFGKEDPVLAYLEGTIRLVQGDPERAIRLLERARREMADNPILLNNLGSAYARAGRYRQAESTFLQVLRLQPSNRPAANSLKAVRAALDSLSRAG